MTIGSENIYASVLIVSLDGEALSESRRVLVQVGARARPTGWAQRSATFKGDDGKQTYQGKQVVTTGKMPWIVEDTKVTLIVKNSMLRTAKVLDLNGNARGDLAVVASAGAIKLAMPHDAMYVVIEAN